MLELKGEIKKEKDRYVGFNHWIKLTIGRAGFKLGEAMITTHMPGLEEYELKIKGEISKQIHNLKNNELAPRLRNLLVIEKKEVKDNAAIKGLKRDINQIESKIKSLEHSLKSHHSLEGKSFRLIIYDGN